MWSKGVGILHKTAVFPRRVRVLSEWIAELLPPNATTLDVGCGDGLVTATVQALRPDVSIRGLDVLRRDHTKIPVEVFDGFHIPFSDGFFDVVILCDVLHHTTDPMILLHEACRVASRALLIKDHSRTGFAAGLRLRFMDWVGNSSVGVALPYNYWTEDQWQIAWRELALRPEHMITRLGLYPGPGDWIFGAKLHFIALLRKPDSDLQRLSRQKVYQSKV